MAGRPRTRFARLNGITCGAMTRKGTACQCKSLLRGGKCKFHGGMSTGAKTAEGKAKQLAGLYRWLAQQRARKDGLNAELGAGSEWDGNTGQTAHPLARSRPRMRDMG